MWLCDLQPLLSETFVFSSKPRNYYRGVVFQVLDETSFQKSFKHAIDFRDGKPSHKTSPRGVRHALTRECPGLGRGCAVVLWVSDPPGQLYERYLFNNSYLTGSNTPLGRRPGEFSSRTNGPILRKIIGAMPVSLRPVQQHARRDKEVLVVRVHLCPELGKLLCNLLQVAREVRR